jgi:dihydrofolate reductase
MAGKVLWHATMSLDGYIADQDDSVDWAFGYEGSLSPSLDEIMARTGAVLIGRRLYDLGATTLAEVKLYGGAYTGPVFVLTHRPEDAVGDPAVRFLIHQVPALVGQGVHLYEGPGGPPVSLEAVEVTRSGQVINHRYRVRR